MSYWTKKCIDSTNENVFCVFIVLLSYAVNIFKNELEKFWKPYYT